MALISEFFNSMWSHKVFRSKLLNPKEFPIMIFKDTGNKKIIMYFFELLVFTLLLSLLITIFVLLKFFFIKLYCYIFYFTAIFINNYICFIKVLFIN